MRMSKSNGFLSVGRLAAVIMLALIGGCASTVAARVTSFQQWPSGVEGQTYRFVVGPEQSNNLEYEVYRDMVRAGIGATGLIEARAGQSARFDVSFDYDARQTQVITRQAYDPYFYGGYGYGRYGWPYGGFGYLGPDWVDVPQIAYQNRLELKISDASQGGKEVYRSSAYTVTAQADLPGAMPYLTRAIFDNFPGNSGAQRMVEYSTGK